MLLFSNLVFDDIIANFTYRSSPFVLSPLSLADCDIDWSVFENAGTKIEKTFTNFKSSIFLLIDRYLLRDDSAWITRLSKDFWWNLERISEMATMVTQQMNSTKHSSQQFSLPSMHLNGKSAGKFVGRRSTITRPTTNDIPMKKNFSMISDQDIDYNPFQSKILFDNDIWTNYSQHSMP